MLHGQLSIIHLLYSYEILGESMAHVVSSPSGHETKVDANSTPLFNLHCWCVTRTYTDTKSVQISVFCWHWWHVLGVGHLAVARSSIVTRWTWNDMKLVQLVLPLLWQWQCMWALPARFMPKVYYLLVCFRIVLMIIWPSVPPALGRTSVTVSGYTFGSSFGAILKMTWFLRINRDCMDL